MELNVRAKLAYSRLTLGEQVFKHRSSLNISTVTTLAHSPKYYPYQYLHIRIKSKEKSK